MQEAPSSDIPSDTPPDTLLNKSAPPDVSSSSGLQPKLEMRAISKRFPGVLANDRVDLQVMPGEVHALLGENGAGKTTLMNILYGLYAPDDGEMLVSGQPVHFKSPRDAMNAGIGLVAQHFTLARRHSVVENIALGLPSTPLFFPTRKLRGQIRELAHHYELDVDPDANIWQLSAGEQQRVEILKALVRGADLLILDEPTSVLTPQEADKLFKVVRQMQLEHKSIIFISHKLDEVMDIADTITVLRKGAVVGNKAKTETNASELANLMMGRAIREAHVTPKAEPELEQAEVVLELDNVSVMGNRNVLALKDISFKLHKGEILGVAGVAGNGQSELTQVLTGLMHARTGQVLLEGSPVQQKSARDLFEAGIAHIPEDRNHTGVVPDFAVEENLILRQYRYQPFSQGQWLKHTEVDTFAKASIQDYDVSTPSQRTPTRLLSGGNVQKLILARELSGQPKVIVAAHPTYGLDVSAAQLTHERLLEQRERGAGVLLVSEDLDELFHLCDRIAVLFAGKLMDIVSAASADRETLGLLMAGRTQGADAKRTDGVAA